MSARGDQLRKLIHSGTKEAAVRAVILHNCNMISDDFAPAEAGEQPTIRPEIWLIAGGLVIGIVLFLFFV